MPYKKFKSRRNVRKPRSRRIVRKYSGYRKYRPRRVLPIGGFGTSSLVRLRYAEVLTYNPTAGNIAINAFRANSVFDPNYTGAGHQPSNYDRWAANFDRYTVVGSRCLVQPFETLASGVNPGMILLHLSEDGTDLSTAHATGGIENILEQPRLTFGARSFGQNNGGRNPSLTKYFSAKKFFKGFKAGADPYSSDISTNPTEGAFFEVAVVSPDDSSDPGSIKVRIIIDYIVLFSEPKLADSS